MTVKITSKGQITIPAAIRKKLNTSVLEISFDGEKIILKPMRNLGGVLKEYAIKDKTIEEIMKLEKEAASNAFSLSDD